MAAWSQRIFIERLTPGESTEASLFTDGHVPDTEIVSCAYEGDKSIHVDLVPGSLAGDLAGAVRTRISRSAKVETPRLARGVLTVQIAGANGEDAAVIEMSVVVFLGD